MRTLLFSIVFGLLLGGSQFALAQDEPQTAFDARIAEAKSAMMGNPAKAFDYAVQAEALTFEGGSQSENKLNAAKALWLQGEALNRMNRSGEAVPVIEKALVLAQEYAPNSKLHGDLLMSRASASRRMSNFTEALASFQSAHDVFQELDEGRSQAIALQNLGSIYRDAHDYKKALDYYEKAGQAFGGDDALNLSRFNNVANTYREMGEYEKAEAGFAEALKIAEARNSAMLRARILTNIAYDQMKQGHLDQADATIDEGLSLADDPAAARWTPFLWGVRAEIARERGETGQAVEFIAKTFAGMDLEKTVMPFRDFHEIAEGVYAAAGQNELALAHHRAFKRLDDEARDVAASANTALLGAQFDFANQELEIANLRSETLEKEINLQKAQARQRTIIFGGAASLALVILIALSIAYASIRRSRNEVRDANDKLSDSNTALEKALKAKSEFLATTSHEIRTPLNGILGMTQILMSDHAIKGESANRLQLVHGAGETMKAIVDDILDVAKMETGEVKIRPDEFDLEQVMKDVGALWGDNANAKNVEFNIDLAECPKRVELDAQRVRQIAFNLLSNAVKFTDEGTIDLTATTVEAENGPELVIEVRDTGIGIPTEEHDLIFEPFHQVDGGTTRQHGGTGLGLSICRKLSRAMGGDVTVKSVPGEGSTFVFRTPVVIIEGASNGDADDGQEKSLSGIAVLESNPLTQCIYSSMFSSEGDVHLAADVEALREMLGQGRFEGVLVNASQLCDNPAEIMSTLLSVKSAADGAKIVVLLGEEDGVESAALRLCGAQMVLPRDGAPGNVAGVFSSSSDDDVKSAVNAD